MKKILILLQKNIDKLNSKLVIYLFDKYSYYVYDDIFPFIEKEKIDYDFWGNEIEECDFDV